ncbi:LytTR family DNA-binding domain-containing protein [Tenacibaculum sp. SG-28]|uniref:LytR/AlgR family response regulator transcription factor n=1 Tax=Tenacibaculum sp. SG-28 TaxID=754426 RepID=UPI000CF3895E|nr:LytTR family DNA-binding domain-containing protein [Tenacibaculum sp. SG-28]PQJ23224.1 DNA-binding response regulator [Tenacibaculum sp. SG-28]
MDSRVIKCVIVDDEPPAIRLLEAYASKVDFLQVVQTTTKSLEVLQIIEKENIDLVFMDVQMPNLTGMQLAKLVSDKVDIIFTTAFEKFATESYERNAVDYLLKPFSFERFYQAVNKYKGSIISKKIENQSSTEFLFIKTDGKNNFERVYIKDIYYLEGIKNYVAIHLNDKQIITYGTLKGIAASLNDDFVQIHKSYIVALQHVLQTDSLSVTINGSNLPIGDTYKKSFFENVKAKSF